ncbi:hypothetical protein G6011_04179 [Alternaria panax]|uniref:RING-type domain-containing protein n=1 Tax=Alternaria panax TaxID=48097 RepID=A0AAD4IGM3_9PLEO|nr:hypothetical protein G6011_04179 [Alternaria panax]
MPSLRSQPEFYMTGVAAVNTTAEPVDANAECTICLEPLSDDVVKFQACGHMFHTVCVQSWFDQSAPRTGHKRGTCPNCRHELYEPDPRYERMAPPHNGEQPVATHGVWHFMPASSNFEQPSRHDTATATTQPYGDDHRNEYIADLEQSLVGGERLGRSGRTAEPSLREASTWRHRGVAPPSIAVTPSPRGTHSNGEADNRHREFVTNYHRPLAAQERAEQAAEAVTQRPSGTYPNNETENRPQESFAEFRRRMTVRELNTRAEQARLGTTRRVPRGEPILGDRRPRANALEHARDDPPVQEDAVSLPPRTSSLPHGGAVRRQHASQITTDALRNAAALPTVVQFRDERVDEEASGRAPNGHESYMPPLTPLEGPRAPTPMVNGQTVQPRESRATLAARAIAQRRPLATEPGLNNRDANLPQNVQSAALNSQHTAAGRNRIPGSRRHRPVTVPPPEPTPNELAISNLQLEQSMLLDRLREVQDQLGRHLQAADASRERRTVMPPPAPNHLLHEPQDDSSGRRPPPIAIPNLADPAVSDLRSAREFPDQRVIGSGTSIWSADNVMRGERGIRTIAPHGRRFSFLPPLQSSRPMTDSPAWGPGSNMQIPLSLGSTYTEIASAERPASADSSVTFMELSERVQAAFENIEREDSERREQSLRRERDELMGFIPDNLPSEPAPTEEDASEALFDAPEAL